VARTDLRLVTLFMVLLVLTQRVGIPIGDSVISVALPLAYLFTGLGLARGLLTVNSLRAGLLAVALSACLVATAAASWAGATWQLSMQSLWFLLALYVPWALTVRGEQGPAVVVHAGRTFVRTMLALSVVAAAQLTAQMAGLWHWTDYLAVVVPEAYVIPDYNTQNELAYGVGSFKANAFVLLEPSFLSQFCALAILVGIVLRVRPWQLLVLGAGLASSVSGTGLVLLGAGSLFLLMRAPRLVRPGYVLAGAGVGALLLFSPVATFLLRRQHEINTEGTSGNVRFVAPYRYVWEALNDEPLRLLVGAGPGSVDRAIPDRVAGGADALYAVLPKLAFEYGILAGALFALFLVVAMLDRVPWRVVPGSLVVTVFVLSGALLQPQTAFLAWLLSSIGASDRPAGTTTAPSG
jgi:hypothetical protein